MPQASTPAPYALILIDMVEQRGFDRADILAETGLAQLSLEQVGARISDSDFNRLATNALHLTGESDLGLQLGLRLHLSAHATLGQAFMTCRDLRQVMDLFLNYYHLLAPNLHLESEVVDNRVILAIHGDPDEGNEVFLTEVLFAAIQNTLGGLLAMDSLAMRIDAPYPPPPHAARYQEIFGEEPRFHSVQPRVSFEASLLDAPLPSSNPALRALYESECARLLADLEETDSVAEQTLRLLRKLEGQYPQMPKLAQMLNFSPRTYRRRLEREQQSYQALLDQVRAEHATRYLQNTRLPLSSIAYMVGFNDASNFRRAYMKWTGHSPGAVRRGS